MSLHRRFLLLSIQYQFYPLNDEYFVASLARTSRGGKLSDGTIIGGVWLVFPNAKVAAHPNRVMD
jgi:hypothetical protein